jgi:hypothetical protein
MPERRVLVLALACASLGMGGCGAKSRECTTLVELIDDDDQALEALEVNGKDSRKLAAATRGLAAVEAKLASDLGGTRFEVAEVKKVAADYQAFATETAHAADEVARTIERATELLEKVDDARPDSATKRWASAVQKVAAACEARPSPVCERSSAAVRAVPEKVDDMALYAHALDKLAGDLRKLPTTDAALRAALDGAERQSVELAKVFADIAELQQKAKRSRAAMDAAVAKERPLSDRVNTLCGLASAKPSKQ